MLPPSHPAPAADAGPAGSLALLSSMQRDKLALIGHMASSAAHELSNPLATIVASTQAILAVLPRAAERPEHAAAGLPLRQLVEDLELVLQEARRAGDIVHGLLASARQDPPEQRICSLADVVRRTVTLCRHHLKLHNIALQVPWFDPHEGYPLWSRVRGDTNQLQQVLLNLLINAEQAITAHRGHGTIRITLAPDGTDRVILTVEDDGPGIPAALRDRVFEPFYTTKPAGHGTGLGLSIANEIARSHGGGLTVEAGSGSGACFRLALPSLAATDAARTPATPGTAPAEVVTLRVDAPEPPAPPPLAILLVDDEASIRRTLARFLGRAGYQVTEARDGSAALEALAGRTYDLVVSDLRMPGLSGPELHARLLQERPDLARRVLFTSGDLAAEETRAFLAASGCPSLQKPFELSELLRTINALCARPPAERRVSA